MDSDRVVPRQVEVECSSVRRKLGGQPASQSLHTISPLAIFAPQIQHELQPDKQALPY